MTYFNFCVTLKFSDSEIIDIMNRMLVEHSDKPDIWLRYIDWNRNTAKKSAASSIDIATQALRIAPRHEELHFELMNIVLSQLDKTATSGNVSVLQEARVIYENAHHKVQKISICLKMLDEATKYHPLAVSLEKQILADMLKHYLREPMFWNAIAQRELKCQITYSETVVRNSAHKYNACVDIYKTAVESVRNDELPVSRTKLLISSFSAEKRHYVDVVFRRDANDADLRHR